MIKLVNLPDFNMQVLEDAIFAGLQTVFTMSEDAILKVYNKPANATGKEIYIPIFTGSGTPQIKIEGEDMASGGASSTNFTMTMDTVALAVDMSREMIQSFDFGDLKTYVVKYLINSYKSKIDKDKFDTLDGARNGELDYSASTIDLTMISEITEDINDLSAYTLFISNKQKHQIRTLTDASGAFIFEGITSPLVKGQIGTLFGALKVVATPYMLADTGVFHNMLIGDESLALAKGSDLTLDSEENKRALVDTITSYIDYGMAINPETEQIYFKSKEA